VRRARSTDRTVSTLYRAGGEEMNLLYFKFPDEPVTWAFKVLDYRYYAYVANGERCGYDMPNDTSFVGAATAFYSDRVVTVCRV